MGGCCDHAWEPSGFIARAGLGFWGGWWPWGWSLQSPSSSTASWGSVVLLVPRRWQQTSALKPHTGDKIGMLGVSTPLATSVPWLLCLQTPLPGLHCHRNGQRNNSHPQLSSCGDSPKGGFSQGCAFQHSSRGCHLHTGAVRAEGAALCPF